MSSLKASYIINGHRSTLSEVPTSKFGKLLAFATFKYSEQLIAFIEDRVCTEHGELPELEVLAHELENGQLDLTYQIVGCCSDFEEKLCTILDCQYLR